MSTNTLGLESLSFSYGNIPILKDVSLTIRPGEIVSLIGPNGSGKSTLIKLAGGLIKPSNGKVSILGKELNRWKSRDLARELAYLPQNPILPGTFSVEESVLLGRTPYLKFLGIPSTYDIDLCSTIIKRVDAAHLKKRFIGDLSGGERQRILLARALVQEPEYLLLDEPTSFLDMHHQVSILTLIHSLAREKGIGVLMVLHDLNLAATFSDRIALLVCGQIRAIGTPSEVLFNKVIKEVYDEGITVFPHPADIKRPAILPVKKGDKF